MNMYSSKKVIPFLAVGLLTVLPGCDFLTKKNKQDTQSQAGSSSANGEVLLTIDGKPAITVSQFEDYYNQVLASDPRLKSMAAFLPNLKQEVFNAMENQELMYAWAEKNEFLNSEDFKKEIEQGLQQMKKMYAAKQFGDKKIGKINVSDAEVKDYYEKHKDPELVAAPGGVKAAGVEFATKDKAQAFYARVNVAPKTFKDTAKTEKLNVKEFAAINKFSFDSDKAIQEKVEGLKTFPSVVLVEGADKKWWVVLAESKQDTKYRSLEEVKDAIVGAVERDKGMQMFGKEMDQLKKEFQIKVNSEYFESQKAETPDLEELLKQQGAQSNNAQQAPIKAKPAVQRA